MSLNTEYRRPSSRVVVVAAAVTRSRAEGRCRGGNGRCGEGTIGTQADARASEDAMIMVAMVEDAMMSTEKIIL